MCRVITYFGMALVFKGGVLRWPWSLFSKIDASLSLGVQVSKWVVPKIRVPFWYLLILGAVV